MIADSAAVLMKVGFHGGVERHEIIAWKQGEILSTGLTYWGYGGSACHPLRQGQPFADSSEEVAITMLWTASRPRGPSQTAHEMSVDGEHWQPVPPGNRITGFEMGARSRSARGVRGDSRSRDVRNRRWA